MTARFTFRETSFVMSECITCGVSYTVPAMQWDKQQRDGGYHFCSNGHQQGWSKSDSETERLRRRAEKAEQQIAMHAEEAQLERDRRKATDRQLAAQKGVVTKIKRRAANGVCPCCSRSFGDLRRHMETKHPNFAEAS
jgi:hypothetical protein